MTRTTMSSMGPMLGMVISVGSALGLAAMTALAAAHGGDQLGNAAALTNGYSAAFLGAAGIAVAGALVALVALRRPAAVAEADASAIDEVPEPIAA